MAVSVVNLVQIAILDEEIAAELTRTAFQLSRRGQTEAADALLYQSRCYRIQALRLRVEAGDEQCVQMLDRPLR